MKNHFILFYMIVFFYLTTLNWRQCIHEFTILSLLFVYVFVCLKLLIAMLSFIFAVKVNFMARL